jgi:hypothetical protein
MSACVLNECRLKSEEEQWIKIQQSSEKIPQEAEEPSESEESHLSESNAAIKLSQSLHTKVRPSDRHTNSKLDSMKVCGQATREFLSACNAALDHAGASLQKIAFRDFDDADDPQRLIQAITE